MRWNSMLSVCGCGCLVAVATLMVGSVPVGDGCWVGPAVLAVESTQKESPQQTELQRQQQRLREVREQTGRFKQERERAIARVKQELMDIQGVGHRHGWVFKRPEKVSHEEEAWIVSAGELRAVECCDLLLNRIDRPKNLPILREGGIGLVYLQGSPAFDALCQIGAPACPPALARIPQEPDLRRRVYLTGLLRHVWGDAEARRQLTELHQQRSNPVEQERLAGALTQIETTPAKASLQEYCQSKSNPAR